MGYDLINANLVDPDLETYTNRGYTVPDVILVKKSYEHARKKRQSKGFVRSWKVAELDMEIDEAGRSKENIRDDKDRELFYQVLPSNSLSLTPSCTTGHRGRQRTAVADSPLPPS